MENKNVKMVIVMRRDLKNTKGEKIHTGKVIAQGAHSVLGFVWDKVKGKKISFEMSDAQYDWYNSGQTKITLKVENEKALMEIFQKAKAAGVFVELITDAGRTEFGEPTKTCLALGPDYADKIDKITGGLSLY
jgi:PTH2 family peptidyl-tRNA hydrolase